MWDRVGFDPADLLDWPATNQKVGTFEHKALPKPPLRLADSGTMRKKLKSGKSA
jgi:hypothetical protein